MRTIEDLYEWLRRFLSATFPRLFPYVDRNKRIIKYCIAGGTAGVADLALLFFFTSVVGLHYLVSAVLAFMLAFGVSFFLQKLWTFRDNSMERVHSQALIYLGVALANLGMNTLLIYLLVDLVAIRSLLFSEVTPLVYLPAQIIASLLIAAYTFFINKFYIFHKVKKDRIRT